MAYQIFQGRGMRMLVLAILASALLGNAAAAILATRKNMPVPGVYTLDGRALVQSRMDIQAAGQMSAAYAHLLKEANKALNAGPFSVVDKHLSPPSGSKHDYLSLAPYWWPDPAGSASTPYIRHDGKINPSSKNEDSDGKRLDQFSAAVSTLSLAYFFSQDERYAQRTALLIRTWFLNPATRMTPHMRYAQAIGNRNTGRGAGIIDARHFATVIDAVGLIAPSRVLGDDETADLKAWFAAFNQWCLTSTAGQQEMAAPNNHGSWLAAQLVDDALFIGDNDLANKVLTSMKERIAQQIGENGQQPQELRRTRSLHYSAFNLQALFRLAHYGDLPGIDLWNYPSANSPALLRALAFLMPYVNTPEAWPYEEIRGESPKDFLALVLQAQRQWKAHFYFSTVTAALETKVPLSADWLLWPVAGFCSENKCTPAVKEGIK